MALTRRNALLGLVVLVIGAGMIGASGAFSSVQADRTMDVQTAGDSGALLKMTPGGDQIVETDTDAAGAEVSVITFNQQNVNANAKTVFKKALVVTNTGQDNIDHLSVEIRDGSGNLVNDIDGDGDLSDDSAIVDMVAYNDKKKLGSMADGKKVTGSPVLGAEGGKVTVGVIIDTRGTTTKSDLPSSGTVTIIAEDTDDLSESGGDQ